ncbi:NrfD/PsrC family molybdoenzyme membrane anchor subunit [Halovenus salina]|uniref:NrfD/PsrC family molybdoenzyme membrane anchor subunit n=1 Tax=Halovenus salina TaxID=1510225 RepID=A0ABD5VWX0_9EURY|nr:NrfD/PsrC family molybdoenzyme membrane anchor subunit [Halovenus salina]
MATKEQKEPEPADIIRPILNTSKWWYIGFGVAAAVALVWLTAFGFQLQEGLIVTNLADWGSGGGATWGLYIGAFIWWVGIAHGGIILSAAVRLFGMTKYQPVARMAELLTLSALAMAGLYIVVHTGRPDRLVTSVVNAYPWTVQTSPLAWDITVITLYFVMTATYIGLTLRYDTYQLRDRLPDVLNPLYSVVLIGYSEKEDEVIERMVWWLALGIIVMAPLLLHGGVIPWLFSLLPSMPGWGGAIQGPQFLSIALTSALSGVIILAYVTRIAYDWGHIFTDRVVSGLTNWLGIFSLIFVWLQLQQVINGLFAAQVRAEVVMTAKLSNPAYQMAIGIMAVVLAYIFAQAIKPSVFSQTRSLIAAFGVLIATLTEKILFVYEGIAYPEFGLYDQVPGHYFPSLVELSSLAGTVALCAIIFMVILKLFPVIELHAVEDHDDHDEEVSA